MSDLMMFTRHKSVIAGTVFDLRRGLASLPLLSIRYCYVEEGANITGAFTGTLDPRTNTYKGSWDECGGGYLKGDAELSVHEIGSRLVLVGTRGPTLCALRDR